MQSPLWRNYETQGGELTFLRHLFFTFASLLDKKENLNVSIVTVLIELLK